MKTTQYKTDGRLWVWITLAVFPLCWFVPCIPGKDDACAPIAKLCDWIVYRLGGQTSHAEASGTGVLLLFFTFISVTIAIVVAWLPQCIIVIFKTKMRARRFRANGPQNFNGGKN